MMKVVDIDSSFVVGSVEELERVLLRRHGKDANAFWLSHATQEYPKLSILVNADLAAIHYIPAEFQAGFRSVGKTPGLESRGTTVFSISKYSGDNIEEPNESVLPFSVALSVATEFFNRSELPTGVEWEEL